MEIERQLTSLELTALGIILKKGPCVAHAVVVEFAGSQTFAYRSGAGSIYPLLKRLTTAGLLKLSKKRYTLTEDGMEALRGWLRPPFPASDLSTNLDVIRSRAYFLKLLSPKEVSEFLAHATTELQRLLESCEKTMGVYKESGDVFSELAMLGAVRETEARLQWIREIATRLDSNPDDASRR